MSRMSDSHVRFMSAPRLVCPMCLVYQLYVHIASQICVRSWTFSGQIFPDALTDAPDTGLKLRERIPTNRTRYCRTHQTQDSGLTGQVVDTKVRNISGRANGHTRRRTLTSRMHPGLTGHVVDKRRTHMLPDALTDAPDAEAYYS